ncbi:hypothetical protein HPB48_014584 [Haemaphysalis longicornis]|uniref:PiggyBac transposable element-derived protein domain-containing protein n=1 Tax=Haemaphysalis longicornis TaxID=44386 RepID=A0A9J6FN05_HAELO|nr:hypothetical protein HPB48_014584 [Haemaphysalis longicornis]
MASPDGLVLDFVIYVGKGTASVEDMRDFGLEGSIIKKLVETLNGDRDTFLFTDRFFTGVKIAGHLVEKKHLSDRNSDGQPDWRCGTCNVTRPGHEARRLRLQSTQ